MILRPYRPSQSLGTWLRYLLWGSMASAVISSIAGLVDAGRISELQDAGATELPVGLVPNASGGPLASLASLVLLAAAVVWLVWQHRSQSNLYALGVQGLRFTPGWVVGWWFVPFANLVMPYRTMRELWTASGVDEGSGLLIRWWALQILRACVAGAMIVTLLLSLSFSLDAPNPVVLFELGPARTARIVGAVSGLVVIAQALVAIRVVARIDAAQVRLLAMKTAVPSRPDLG